MYKLVWTTAFSYWIEIWPYKNIEDAKIDCNKENNRDFRLQYKIEKI